MMLTTPDFIEITPTAEIRTDRHGNRAKCLQRLIRLDLPVPMTVALSFDTVRAIAQDQLPDMAALVGLFGDGALLSVRSSSQAPDWGGPGTILNIGMNDAVHARLEESFGTSAADAFYVSASSAPTPPTSCGWNPTGSTAPITPRLAKSHYEEEMEEAFPQDPAVQLAEVLKSMARAWEGTSARLLQAGAGRASDAGLGLVVQRMARGPGKGLSGAGVIQFVSSDTGEPQVTGATCRRGRGARRCRGPRRCSSKPTSAAPRWRMTRPTRWRSSGLSATLVRTRLREEMQIEFTLMDGQLQVLDAVRVPRSARAAVAIAIGWPRRA
jgi:pyruvate,orthophosphate dikinase